MCEACTLRIMAMRGMLGRNASEQPVDGQAAAPVRRAWPVETDPPAAPAPPPAPPGKA